MRTCVLTHTHAHTHKQCVVQNARNPNHLFNAFHSQLYGLFIVLKFFYGLKLFPKISCVCVCASLFLHSVCLDSYTFTSITNILGPFFYSCFFFQVSKWAKEQQKCFPYISIVPHYYANVWRFISSSSRVLFTHKTWIAGVMDAYLCIYVCMCVAACLHLQTCEPLF